MAPLAGRSAIALLVAGAAAALAASPCPAAEFAQGVAAYENKDFAAARAVFLDLAALGDAPSQYDLGAMALRGEGTPKDRGEAVGWMLAARENGHDPTPRRLAELEGALSPEERARADAVVARVGRAALERTVLPAPDARPGELRPPKLVKSAPIKYPAAALDAGVQGLVVLRVVMGADGRPRDPEVILAVQSPVASSDSKTIGDLLAGSAGASAKPSDRSFADEALRTVLERRYEPARLEGAPIEVMFNLKLTFLMPDGRLMKKDVEQRLAAAAQAGDPHAQFVVGVIGLAAETRGAAANPGLIAAAKAGVPEAQLMVGTLMARGEVAAKALPWLERASRAGLPAAHVRYAMALLQGGGADPARVRELLSRASEETDRYAARHAAEVLACSNAPGLRDPQVALALARRAKLDDDADPLSLEAYAAAEASAGDRAAAVRAQRSAISRARRLDWAVDAMELRLAEYDAGRPCQAPFLPGSERFVAAGDRR